MFCLIMQVQLLKHSKNSELQDISDPVSTTKEYPLTFPPKKTWKTFKSNSAT